MGGCQNGDPKRRHLYDGQEQASLESQSSLAIDWLPSLATVRLHHDGALSIQTATSLMKFWGKNVARRRNVDAQIDWMWLLYLADPQG